MPYGVVRRSDCNTETNNESGRSQEQLQRTYYTASSITGSIEIMHTMGYKLLQEREDTLAQLYGVYIQ